ncbi:unnamed protein product [Acanthosepion pharaonis]|uniref:Uncharacterized protein n=1 Tax=Acanthosepion pharaonis TaxID=158019 RepID=A0A812DM55_ACAPH|nr:unnamed protein product [Sepia pharaonis]
METVGFFGPAALICTGVVIVSLFSGRVPARWPVPRYIVAARRSFWMMIVIYAAAGTDPIIASDTIRALSSSLNRRRGSALSISIIRVAMMPHRCLPQCRTCGLRITSSARRRRPDAYTETMLHRAVRRLRAQACGPCTDPWRHGPSPQASWITPGRQHRPVSNPAVCLRQRDQNVPGRPLFEAAGIEEPASMAMPAMAAATQQAAVRTEGNPADWRLPASNSATVSPANRRTTGQLRAREPGRVCDKASNVPRSCLRLAAPASAPSSYSGFSPTSLQTASTSLRRRSSRSQSTAP